jgi:hypothetical protein
MQLHAFFTSQSRCVLRMGHGGTKDFSIRHRRALTNLPNSLGADYEKHVED